MVNLHLEANEDTSGLRRALMALDIPDTYETTTKKQLYLLLCKWKEEHPASDQLLALKVHLIEAGLNNVWQDINGMFLCIWVEYDNKCIQEEIKKISKTLITMKLYDVHLKQYLFLKVLRALWKIGNCSLVIEFKCNPYIFLFKSSANKCIHIIHYGYVTYNIQKAQPFFIKYFSHIL